MTAQGHWWFRGAGFLYSRAARFLSGRGLSRIALLRKCNAFLDKYFRSCRPEFVEILGNRFYLDKQDTLGLSFADYEKGVVELIKKNLHEGDIFVDVGANIGYFTVIAAGVLKGRGRIFAFEPAPENFSVLLKQVRENGFTNVVAEEKAVADAGGTAELFLSRYNPGDHRTYDPEASPVYRDEEHERFDQHSLRDRRRSISVPAVALDEYFCNRPASCVMKIDVQGGEGAVLKGARAILTGAPRAVVVMEFWPIGMKLFGAGPDEAMRTLEECGFRNVYELDGRKEKWARTSFDSLRDFCRTRERVSLNVCFSKEPVRLP